MAQQPTSTVPHYEILKNALPDWLGNASTDRRSALLDYPTPLDDWYKNATDLQHQALKRLNSQAWIAQNLVDKALADLKSPEAFGTQLLQKALKDQYGIDVDVTATYLQLYIPLTLVGFTVKPGAARTWSVSMLEAALHNFEQSETQPDSYEASSDFTTQPTASGQFQTLPAINKRLSIPQFTTLCRNLDIGGQYQRYLNEYLDLGNPVAQASLQHKLKGSQLAALELALYMALLKKDVQNDDYLAVLDLIGKRPESTPPCTPLLCYDLMIMSTHLVGIVLFAQDLEASQQVVPVIAWIPDDPEHPIKQYPSTRAFMLALRDKLRDADYQRFFSRFIGHADQGAFFADLNQRLTQVTWHRHTPGDPLPSWRETPQPKANLQFRSKKINLDLLKHLYQIKQSKLLNDTRSRATSTASADQKARWEHWALIEKIGSTLLQIVAFIAVPFVPPLGALMLGYTAYQVLDEAFEGIVDWAEGLGRQALGHALSVMEQLVQLGMFAVGVPIGAELLHQALPAELQAFIARFAPVTRPGGQKRLWQPDLTPYRQNVKLPNYARPDEQGLYQHRGESILRLDDEYYALHRDPVSDRYSVKHPTRPSAYRPHVMTNNQGGWITELERPLTWDSQTLMRRLGYSTEPLSDAQLQRARNVSATHDNTLRHTHINQQPTPPLLADTLKRFTIDQALQDLITQFNSDDPAVYHRVDAQAQLQLLMDSGLWPSTKTLRFLDAKGNISWERVGQGDASVVQIHEAQLSNGDLLRTLIESLDESERKILLDEPFGTPPSSSTTRANVLRKRLGGIAYNKRFSLFDSRYRGEEVARNARVQKIIDAAPNRGLPTSIAEEILTNASGEELRAIDRIGVPKRLADLAEWAQHEVRTTRAYEGLYLESVESPDTAMLALHSLEQLPGWSSDTRLEVREYQANGKLLDAIGPENATLKRTLVATVDGRYIPHEDDTALFGQTDFYTAILQALPDAQRNALNIHIGQGDRLKQLIGEHPIGRQPLRALLEADPQFKPAYDPSVMRLRGGMEGYRPTDAAQPGPSAAPSLEQQAHDLLPSLPRERLSQFVQRLESQPGGAQLALATLRNEYLQMDHGLARWVRDTPRVHPTTGAALSPAEHEYALRDRHRASWEIRRAWRLETAVDNYYDAPTANGYRLILDTPLLGQLPELNARFDHVSQLELTGAHTPLQLHTFLRLFPRLRHLAIRRFILERFPSEISSMPALNELILSDCNLTLTEADHASLRTISRLVTLDLYNNPLSRVPAVDHMPGLQYLDLTNTGISELPRGLLTRSNLDLALLSRNRIQVLPTELFTLPAAISDKFDLSGNPVSLASLERVKTYFQRTAKHWEIDAPAADVALVKRLYPSSSPTQINRFIFALPGNLEAGRLALNRLDTDFRTIRSDLIPWAENPNANRAEQTSRALFIHDLETAWRRDIPPDPLHHGAIPGYALTLSNPVSGPLPSLRTSLPHVTSLTLSGNGASLRLGDFLQAFPNLRALTLERYRLDESPLAITGLRQLTYLRMNRNTLKLSTTQANALAGMSQLEHLDLSHNPLDMLPDFSRLTRLNNLSLRNTGLKQIPSSLLPPHRSPGQVDLSHNQIEVLPDKAFTLEPSVVAGFDLSNNPLSTSTLRSIKSAFQSTGNFWKATPPAAELLELKALYPNVSDLERARIYFQLPGDVDAAMTDIRALADEFEQMSTQLQEWTLSVPVREPLLDTVLDPGARAEEQLRRSQFKTLLERCWRREVEFDENGPQAPQQTYKLIFHAQLLGDMPTLNAQFNHVTLLELIGEGSNQRIDGLLRCFPNLLDLTVEQYALGDIPEAVFTLNDLRNLVLCESRIQLSRQSVEQLAGMDNLTYLDLSDNPLGITPDVRNMSRLIVLYLHNCDLAVPPVDVFELEQLRILDLSDNQIVHLPGELLERSRPFNDESDLSGNPLSEESIALLRRYYQQTGYDMSVEEARTNEFGVPLVPPPASSTPMEE